LLPQVHNPPFFPFAEGGWGNGWRNDMSRTEETEALNEEVGYLVYNETLIDHFMHPRNVGEIENPDAMAVVGDPACGDFIRVYLRVEDDRISAFKFLTQGCPGAISTSSIATELAIGKTLEEALKLTDNDVIEAAGGIPARKAHCSLLAIRGLHQAITHYREKRT
jgi:nitrogen fixation NifU-like protein